MHQLGVCELCFWINLHDFIIVFNKLIYAKTCLRYVDENISTVLITFMNNDELKRNIFCLSRNEKVHKTIEHVIEGFYLNSYRIIRQYSINELA